MNIDHRNCDHEATSKDRAACRKARAIAEANRSNRVFELIRVFNSASYMPAPNYWVFYAANRFAGYQGSVPYEAASAILDHFLPTFDEATDTRRIADGYTITSSPSEMLSITLHAAS